MKQSELIVTFLGCGNMGSAVLEGLLNALYPDGEESPAKVNRISHFIACTNTETSAQKLAQQLGRHSSRVEVVHGANLAAMKRADVVVLGVKPYFAKDVLEEAGVREALAGKLVMSMIPGSVDDLKGFINGNGNGDVVSPWVVKAIPNIAARHGQSMTIVDQPEPPLPHEEKDFMDWFWGLIGSSLTLPPAQSNAGMMTMTACLAGLSISLEGLLDGSVREGLRRNTAMEISLQSLKSLVSLLENGTHPAVMRENMASPRGCTIATILSLEKAGARGTFAQAMLDGAAVFADRK